MDRYKVIVSTLIQNEYEVEAESQEEAYQYIRDKEYVYEEAKYTQYTNSYLLKEDLEIIKILEESASLETAKKKIIDVINRETGEKYGSKSKRCIFSRIR